MIAEKQWCNTICYSAGPADILNRKALKIDCRLFLFSCYNPKPYIESESYYSKFRTAIINLYGLIKDCGLNTWSVMFNTRRNDSILWHDYGRIKNAYSLLWDVTKNFRSIFCHNCSPELRLNEECYNIVDRVVSQLMPNILSAKEMEEPHWQQMLSRVVELSQEVVDGIDSNLNSIISTTDSSRKEKVINRWISQIAFEYCRNPDYLLHTMAVLYQAWINNGGDTTVLDLRKELRQQTTNWLCRFCNIESGKPWYSKWLDEQSIHQMIVSWPQIWAQWYNREEDECNEAPGIDSGFFRFLAEDVDRFAREPRKGYKER